MKKGIIVATELRNYYGEVCFVKVWSNKDEEYKYKMELEDYYGIGSVDISKDLFEEALNNFGNPISFIGRCNNCDGILDEETTSNEECFLCKWCGGNHE